MRHWIHFSSKGKSRLHSPFAITLVVGLAALASVPRLEALFGSFDQVHFDIVLSAMARPASDSVMLVGKGERSLRILGREKMFSPALNAQLIDDLRGAASIVFDIPLPAREQYDTGFFEAVKRNGRVVVGLPSTDIDADGRLLLPLPDPAPESAAAIGQREISIGDYDVVTGLMPYRAIGDAVYPHVVLAALNIARSNGETALRVSAERAMAYVGAADGSNARTLRLLLPRVKSIKSYSFADVVEGRVPPSEFNGKIVFVGHEIFRPLGIHKVSAINEAFVSGTQLDAMFTSALLAASVVNEIPPVLKLIVNVAVALGMLLICELSKARRLHVFALLWAGAILGASTLALAIFRVWVPVGASLAVCALVYVYFAWSQLFGMHQLLKREIDRLREISTGVGAVRFSPVSPGGEVGESTLLDEVKVAMRQIREWQEAYVAVINLLPYPVFLERARKLALWNSRGAELLDEYAVPSDSGEAGGHAGALREVLERFAALDPMNQPARECEISVGGRDYKLMNVPFTQFSPLAVEDDVASLICLIDIDDVKRSVSQDRQTLRHIAHDLRNPLTTILALIEQHSSKAGASSDEKFMADLRRLVSYSLRMAQDFMQLSRAEALDPATFSSVVVDDVVDEALDQVAAIADAKSIDISLERRGNVSGWVTGNRDMLLRTIVNVLDNAIKYSPSGTSVNVILERESRGGHAFAVIRVRDNGVGIPEDAMEKIFEPFYQVGASKRDAAAGVGLGLAFVKAVMERHAGKVLINRRAGGRGTEAVLMLPIGLAMVPTVDVPTIATVGTQYPIAANRR